MKSAAIRRMLCGVWLGLAAPGLALAIPVQIFNRSDLGATDSVDWAQLGSSGTSVPSGSTAVSGSGAITVTLSANNLERRDQGSGWAGNFAPGAALVWTGNAPSPLTIVLDQPVRGVGAQIQADFYGAYTGHLDLYDLADTLIASFDANGVATSSGNDTAVFLGALDSFASIKKLVYTLPVASGGINDFAINQLSLTTKGSDQAVPEIDGVAGTAALAFLAGCLGLLTERRRVLPG